jgi:hypothetical protein
MEVKKSIGQSKSVAGSLDLGYFPLKGFLGRKAVCPVTRLKNGVFGQSRIRGSL